MFGYDSNTFAVRARSRKGDVCDLRRFSFPTESTSEPPVEQKNTILTSIYSPLKKTEEEEFWREVFEENAFLPESGFRIGQFIRVSERRWQG